MIRGSFHKPKNPEKGTAIYNETDDKYLYYDGKEWVDISDEIKKRNGMISIGPRFIDTLGD